MKFSKKSLPKSQIAIEVELAPEELTQHRQEAVATLARDIQLEGFRPGHVPSHIAEKHLGETAILAEVAHLAIGKTYRNIVEEEQLDVIGEPEVEVLKLAPGNPFEFRVQVAILPGIELPDYKKVAGTVKKREVQVEEKNVDEALQWLRESRKTKDGMTPEATNEFAQSVGNFPDLASLRASIQEGLQHEKEMQERDRLRQEIVEKIATGSKLEVPDVLCEREKQVLLSEIKRGVEQMLGMSFEQYLQQSAKSEQELLDSFTQEAEQRVRRFLVVREVAKREAITPSQEEIEQEANVIVKHYANVDQAKQKLDLERVKEYTEGILRHEKTLQFLEQFAI